MEIWLNEICDTNNSHDSNSIIDLVFLPPNNTGFGQHTLYSELQKPWDHVPLIIKIEIKEVNINITFQSI